MNLLLWNIALAVTWAAVTGSFTLPNLAVGFVLGYLALWLVHRSSRATSYFRKMRAFVAFVFFCIYELVRANIRVAHDVVTRTVHMRPGVVAIPLDAESDAEITTLANLITLTPGTLSLDVSEDRNKLFIHAMFIRDADELRDQIKQGFERRLLELFR